MKSNICTLFDESIVATRGREIDCLASLITGERTRAGTHAAGASAAQAFQQPGNGFGQQRTRGTPSDTTGMAPWRPYRTDGAI